MTSQGCKTTHRLLSTKRPVIPWSYVSTRPRTTEQGFFDLLSDRKNRASVQIVAEVPLEKSRHGVKKPRLARDFEYWALLLTCSDRGRYMHVWKPLMAGTVTEYGDMESMALRLVHGVYGKWQMSVAQSLPTT